MSTPVIYWIPFSPWSEMACWALDFHKLPYKKVEYSPYVMAPLLKLKTLTKRKFSDKLTVPLLIDDSAAYTNSFDIALYAENEANSEQLFPKTDYDRIKRLNALSERLLNVFRAQVLKRIKDNQEFKLDKLSTIKPLSFLPEKWLESLTYTADFMIDFLIKKYPVDESEPNASLLEKIRAEIGDRPYVLNEFSYADITLAMPLQFVAPVGNQYINLGDQQRKTMENIELAKEFKDLIDWRDQLYEKHRN